MTDTRITHYRITEVKVNYGASNTVREVSVVAADALFDELEACGVPRRLWTVEPGHSNQLNGRYIAWEAAEAPNSLTPAQAAQNGAEYLDERHPGWASLINPDLLDMSRCTRCILGQTHLWSEVDTNGLDPLPLERLGFMVPAPTHLPDPVDPEGGAYEALVEYYRSSYAALTAAWLTLVAGRNEEEL